MIAAALAILLAQNPSPLPTTWIAEPLQGSSEYARYVRHESSGEDSTLIGTRQVCDCTPSEEVALMLSAVHSMPTATTTVNANATICGEPADDLLITNIADQASGRLNLEVTFFRRGDTLYMIEYTFPYAAPMSDVQAARSSLCPT